MDRHQTRKSDPDPDRLMPIHNTGSRRTTMNEELLATSAFLVQSGTLLVSDNVFINFFCSCPMLSQPKSAVHQQAAKLYQQHWRHLKGNYHLNSDFEKANRLLE